MCLIIRYFDLSVHSFQITCFVNMITNYVFRWLFGVNLCLKSKIQNSNQVGLFHLDSSFWNSRQGKIQSFVLIKFVQNTMSLAISVQFRFDIDLFDSNESFMSVIYLVTLEFPFGELTNGWVTFMQLHYCIVWFCKVIVYQK